MSLLTAHKRRELYGSEAHKELNIDTVLELLVKIARQLGGGERERAHSSLAQSVSASAKNSGSQCGNGDIRKKPCTMSWSIETKPGS
jgi:hypothetical protein